MADAHAERIKTLTEKRKRFADEGNDAKVALIDQKLEQAKAAQDKNGSPPKAKRGKAKR